VDAAREFWEDFSRVGEQPPEFGLEFVHRFGREVFSGMVSLSGRST
jgi:hypothetical protein